MSNTCQHSCLYVYPVHQPSNVSGSLYSGKAITYFSTGARWRTVDFFLNAHTANLA